MVESSNSVHNLLIKSNCKIKVSSILDNNAKQFGSQFLIDGSEETCWSSGQGKSQTIQIDFIQKPKFIDSITLIVEEGFSPKSLEIYVYRQDPKNGDEPELLDSISTIQNTSLPQKFKVEKEVESGIFSLKLFMNQFADFFGRVTITSIEIMGY